MKTISCVSACVATSPDAASNGNTTTVPEYIQHTISGSATILAAFTPDLVDYTLDFKPI